MNYYLVLTKETAERIDRELNCEGKVPKSDLRLLAEYLGAELIPQQPCKVSPIDRIKSIFGSTPELWAFARSLKSQLEADAIVFCHSEEIGIPLAHVYGKAVRRPKLVVWLHRITGLRTRIALKLFAIAKTVDLAVVNSRPNQKFLQEYLKFNLDRILFLRHAIDSSYFAPQTDPVSKTRPLIVSVGLEQRDYRLLAAATENLDVDVKVAGFSQFFSRIADTFPEVMPQNMTNRKYTLPELLELYYQADIVAICLQENSGAAGITALLEAMSCRKPVICVRTSGLAEYLIDDGAVISIEPGDVPGLQAAITHLLNKPEEAQARAARAYQIVQENHVLANQAKLLAKFIQSLEPETEPSQPQTA